MKLHLPVFILAMAAPLRSAGPDIDAYRPHTPTLIYHLANAGAATDADAIRASVQKLPSVSKIVFASGAVQIRFDSHIVSYHQVAQAISDAGAALGKTFDPRLKILVPDYGKGENAAKVDALFAGKRLNQRVRIEPGDKSQGEFILHFLPLTVDPAESGPQGFNGGHLHHPLHDAPPRGLGLECDYESSDTATAKQLPRKAAEKPAPKP